MDRASEGALTFEEIATLTLWLGAGCFSIGAYLVKAMKQPPVTWAEGLTIFFWVTLLGLAILFPLLSLDRRQPKTFSLLGAAGWTVLLAVVMMWR